jgi:hypothetical protein
MATRIALSIVDHETENTAALYQWLLEDPAIRRIAIPELKASSGEDGAMGGVVMAIELVINEGATLGTLAVAIAQWLRPHPTPPTVSLTCGSVKILVSDGQAKSIGQALTGLASGESPDEERAASVTDASEP